MSDASDHLAAIFLEVEQLIEALDAAFDKAEWETAELLLQKRNAAIDKAVQPGLPEEYQRRARSLLNDMRGQDNRIARLAEQRRDEAMQELMKLRRGRKSADAYRNGGENP